jgi:hypothetical protein
MEEKTFSHLLLITCLVIIKAQNNPSINITTPTTTTPPSFNYKNSGSDWVWDCQKAQQSPINIQVFYFPYKLSLKGRYFLLL